MLKVVDEFRKRKVEINEHREALLEKCKQVDELRDRILNHGAHPTGEPLFAAELAAGVLTIEQMQQQVRDCLQWFKDFESDILNNNQI